MNCLTSNSWPTNFFAARSSISNLYNDCSFEPDFLNCCEGLQVIAEQSRRVDAKLLVNGGFGHHAGSFFDGVDVGGCLGGAVAQRRRDRLARLDKVAVDDLADVRSHVSRHALKTEMVRQSNERARQLRAFFKIDLLAGDDARFELFREHGGGGKATDQLHAALGEEVGTAVVGGDDVD